MEKQLKYLTLILACCLIGLLLFAPVPVPLKKTPIPKKPLAQKQWYLVNHAVHQVSTAYTEPPGAPLAASARPYFLGSVAVHPKVPGGSQIDPIIPFGTIIMLENPKTIKVQGRDINAFTVLDTGDAYWSLWPDSPYWIDVYFGTGEYWNTKAASDYGKKFVDYYWYEPIE
ncbi:MAG: hypothetical protein ACM3PP_04225 [Candidatus Saccharibacteria bacterium]